MRLKGVFIYVAGRTCLFAVAALAALAFGCPAALAANQTVTAQTNPDEFVQKSVTITQGETVTWMNVGGGLHNVHFDDDSFIDPAAASTTAWTVYRTFTQPGTYPYYCEIHGGPGGFQMSGTVTVNAPPPTGGGGGGGGGGGVPPPVPDTAPVSSLVSPSKQDVDKLFVRASMNEAGTLSAAGTVSAPTGAAKVYKLKRATKSVGPNAPVKLRLKLSKRALKAVKRRLRQKKKLYANVVLEAVDTTGHKTLRKLKVRLTK